MEEWIFGGPYFAVREVFLSCLIYTSRWYLRCGRQKPNLRCNSGESQPLTSSQTNTDRRPGASSLKVRLGLFEEGPRTIAASAHLKSSSQAFPRNTHGHFLGYLCTWRKCPVSPRWFNTDYDGHLFLGAQNATWFAKIGAYVSQMIDGVLTAGQLSGPGGLQTLWLLPRCSNLFLE